MPIHRKVYARSIIRRLKKQVALCPDRVLILSPYFSSQAAETVIFEASASTAEIYTLFAAESFVTGASSLATLRHLLERGYHVYHLCGLHAKVIITENFASVGSQNLTVGGTRNLEVSFALTEKRAIEYLRSEVDRWILGRMPITVEMVRHMEAILPALRAKNRNLKKAAADADKTIFDQEADRERERRRLQDEERIRHSIGQHKEQEYSRIRLSEKSKHLREAVRSIKIEASRRIYCRLATKIRYDEWGVYEGEYITLERIKPNSSFVEWKFQNNGGYKTYTLTKRQRYLLIFLDNGRLGWPALNKTQITQFGISMKSNTPHQIGQHQYDINYEFSSTTESLLTWNVAATIRNYGYSESPGIVVHGYFSLDDLKFVHMSYTHPRALELEEIADLHSDISRNPTKIMNVIRNGLLTPFYYKANRYGIGADRFFEGQGRNFEIQLHRLDGYSFLTAQRRS